MTVLQGIDALDVSGDKFTEPLPLLSTTRHGVLSNNITYYVRYCSKPKQRAALKLVLRVGSILEEEHERGVAHIIEHLAFNASGAYSNHEVVQRLESLGLAFGPCQNASTGVEETSFELLVPTDDTTILSEALSILREFAFGIRCGVDDLDKERGPVLEEWRAGRTATGRAAEAHWRLMLKGSKYADRLPIGLESVIRHVAADDVRAFYDKWYQPEHMAVIAVGDFACVPEFGRFNKTVPGAVQNVDAVVDTIVKEMSQGQRTVGRPPAAIPSVLWQDHSEVRCQVFTDREMPHSAVYVHFIQEAGKMQSPADYLEVMKADMLLHLVNRRFSLLCRDPDAAFYSVAAGKDSMVSALTAHYFEITPFEGKLLTAVEAALVEIARLRIHGLSQRELAIAQAEYLMEIETMYLERDQEDASDVAAEYARHFTKGELVIGADVESRLCKTLVGMVTLDDVMAVAEKYRSTSSCVIKVMQHASITTEAEILQVVERVNAMERDGKIEARVWVEAPEALLAEEPTPGSVVSEKQLDALGASELTLSNGMRVTYRCTDLLADQVLMSGFAAGGLSELSMAEGRHARFAPLLATELGAFGFKPHVLQDILIGKRADVVPGEGAFWRTISGEQSPYDLETTMQLVHKLFVHRVVPDPKELRSCLMMARQMIQAQIREPMQRFVELVRHINYSSPYFQPPSVRDIDRLNVDVACSHFNASFQNPAAFTLCFVGAIEVDSFRDLVCRYLASIPEARGAAVLKPSEISPLEFSFPRKPVNATVPIHQQEPITQVQLTFPVELALVQVQLDGHWVSLLSKVVEARLMRRLRFERSDVYTCAASFFAGCEAPTARGSVRGDLAVSFTCAPGRGRELADVALAEVLALQEEGPSEAEVSTALTIEQRERETMQEDNSYWMTMLLKSYQGYVNAGHKDPDDVHRSRLESRLQMRAEANSETFKACMRRLLPYPCTRRYTVVATTNHFILDRVLLEFKKRPVTVCGLVAGCAGLLVAGLWFVLRGRRQ